MYVENAQGLSLGLSGQAAEVSRLELRLAGGASVFGNSKGSTLKRELQQEKERALGADLKGQNYLETACFLGRVVNFVHLTPH